MEPKKILGKRIQEYRKLKNLTQEVVAEKVGIDTISLSKIETGRNYPTSENLEKITKILGVELYELFIDNHVKTNDELLAKINEGLDKISKDNKKLHIIKINLEDICKYI